VVDTLEASEASGEGRLAEVAEYLELPVTLVRAAVRYYADQRDEVEAWRRRNREIAERERVAWELPDFAPLIRSAVAAGESHLGVIFSSQASMPRGRQTIGRFVQAIDVLMKRFPGDAGFAGRVEWL
jgi:hypothetical protein